jgi:hypothetical protein
MCSSLLLLSCTRVETSIEPSSEGRGKRHTESFRMGSDKAELNVGRREQGAEGRRSAPAAARDGFVALALISFGSATGLTRLA